MRYFSSGAVLAAALVCTTANAAVVASEDYEAGATGWSNNKTEDPGANSGGFSRHLGRWAAGNTISKTFTLSGNQTSVNIAFDFYRIDTWDGEVFNATVTDGVNTFTSSTQGFFYDGPANYVYGFGQYSDRKVPISFDFATAATSLTLTFSSTLDQDISDESWGVDNLLITDNFVAGPGVPEPAAWAMMIGGFGVAGGVARRQRRGSAVLAA